jgi:hypothetical protein
LHAVQGISTVGAGEVVIADLGGEFLTLANVGCERIIRFAIQALNLRFEEFFGDGVHILFFLSGLVARNCAFSRPGVGPCREIGGALC